MERSAFGEQYLDGLKLRIHWFTGIDCKRDRAAAPYARGLTLLLYKQPLVFEIVINTQCVSNVRPERRGTDGVETQTGRAIPRPLQADGWAFRSYHKGSTIRAVEGVKLAVQRNAMLIFVAGCSGRGDFVVRVVREK